jgi:hypothetical protein
MTMMPQLRGRCHPENGFSRITLSTQTFVDSFIVETSISHETNESRILSFLLFEVSSAFESEEGEYGQNEGFVEA